MYWMPKLHFYNLNLVKGSPTPEPFYARGENLRNIVKIYRNHLLPELNG